MGSVALQHVGSSSPTKDRTRIPCIGRQTPNHWTIRAVPEVFFSLSVFSAGQSFLSLRWVGITLPCGEQSSHSGGVSCCGAQALGTGSVVCSIWALVAHGMWNLPGPGIKSHPLHWQADSYPLYHCRNTISWVLNASVSCKALSTEPSAFLILEPKFGT